MTEFKNSNFTTLIMYSIPKGLYKPVPKSVTWLYCPNVFKICYKIPSIIIELL